MNTVSKKTTRMILTAVFAAIIIVMASVPYLGYINLGIISATTIHIPVIVGAILLGPKSGAVLGFVFGLTSCIKATIAPNLTSFCFSPFIGEGGLKSLIVCFVPRILIGIVAYYVYRALAHVLRNLKSGKITLPLIAAGVAGSMTNTLLVMNLIYFLFMNEYAEATGTAVNVLYSAILTIIVGAGIPEAIVCAIITTALCRVMLPLFQRNGLQFQKPAATHGQKALSR